jgi:uncharacterized protein YodC (DUF2158 family)
MSSGDRRKALILGTFTLGLVVAAPLPPAQAQTQILGRVGINGDGKTQIVQPWDNNGRLGMIVYSPQADGSYAARWGTQDIGQGSGALAWLPVTMNGDGKTQIVQPWDNNGRLGMIVYSPQADGSYAVRWGTQDIGQGSGALAWLPVTMNGDGKTQIVQPWDNNGRLGMIVYSPQADGSYAARWGTQDIGQGSGALAWLPVTMNGDGKTHIVQPWNNAPAQPSIPPIPGVIGLPILTTDYQNTDADISQPEAAEGVCVGKRWLAGGTTPSYEWMQVYNQTGKNREYEQNVVGLSGLALFPPDVASNGGLSSKDVPFTHPFGFDWETFIAPDLAYTPLLAPSNGPAASRGEYQDAVAHATNDLKLAGGVLGVETDQGLIPGIYRAREGDRVAVFGRWIVDCGHDDFHTEIHPPLLFVTARAVPPGSGPDILINDATGSVTFSRVIGRPFLVGQEFGDGALRVHLEKEGRKHIELRARPEIIESTSDRVNMEFTTTFSYHIWWW